MTDSAVLDGTVDTSALLAAPTPSARRARRSILGAIVRDPIALLSVLVLLIVSVCAIAPGLLAAHEPSLVTPADSLKSPGGDHVFGTDQFGRDILSRVIHGARISLIAGIATTLVAVVIGTVIGLLAGYFGGIIDNILMRVIDTVLAFPALLLALTIIAIRGRGLVNLIIAIGIASVPSYARLMRAQVLSIRRLPYIEAAEASGSSRWTIATQHLLPNAAPPLVIVATMGIGFSILAVSSLSFLGLGPQPPAPEWGAMLAEGRTYLVDSPWIAMFPGIAIGLTVLSINVLGQLIREHVEGSAP